MEISSELAQRIKALQKKYASMGQDLNSYMDGLLYADYLTYWDYVHLDTLLSLQTPKTTFPDEEIFIMYHQITELYFKLILHACNQINSEVKITAEAYKVQMRRIVSYFKALTSSFEVMITGMDKEQFLKFRMSLLPASGFQSAQYRLIELVSTDMHCLVHHTKRKELAAEQNVRLLYPHLYWKKGATELATGKKTLTLRQFEKKYGETFIQEAELRQTNNLWLQYKALSKAEQNDAELLQLMREHDFNANVVWPLMHYKSAVRYLNREPKEIAATGGTNWQKYLAPKNQRIIFYPSLWDDETLAEWGKKISF